jgi:hypothetical protein
MALRFRGKNHQILDNRPKTAFFTSQKKTTVEDGPKFELILVVAKGHAVVQ